MIAIWKFPIEITRRQTLSAPENPKVLHVGLDSEGAPCLWIQVLTTNTKVDLPVAVLGTGHAVPTEEGWSHAGSFVSGPFVWHVFTQH